MNAAADDTLIGEAHAHIDACIEAGQIGDLNVVGFGEITLAVAWPTQEPRIVLKRLPPFATRGDLDEYRVLLDDWINAMTEHGVAVVNTRLHVVEHPRWGILGYLVQPLLLPDDLALARCQRQDGQETESILAAIVGAVALAVDAQLAFDPQLTNWAVREDGSVAMMDVSTPFLRDAQGRDRLSTHLFVRGYPAVLRPALSRLVLPSVIDAYHSPRTAIRDFAGNLIRLGLEPHLRFVLENAHDVLGIDLDESEVREFFGKDARMWATLQTLRRTDKWWQTTVRRRPYPALLPPKYNSRTDYNSELRPVRDPRIVGREHSEADHRSISSTSVTTSEESNPE